MIVVDSGVPQKSDEVLAAIRSITDKHILFVINTSADPDHVGGNENLSKAGWALPDASLNPLIDKAKKAVMQPGASIIAHINVLNRMSAPAGKESASPQAPGPRIPMKPTIGSCTTARACSSIIRRMRTPTATATCYFASPMW